jgi:hypothetical protein
MTFILSKQLKKELIQYLGGNKMSKKQVILFIIKMVFIILFVLLCYMLVFKLNIKDIRILAGLLKTSMILNITFIAQYLLNRSK